MLVSTKAIVLYHKKYNDASVILHLFTKNLGRIPVMAYGIWTKKHKKTAYIQPLSLVDVVIENKSNRQIQVLKEIKPYHILNSIGTDMYKSTQAIFIAEVLSKVISEEHTEPEIFDFTEASVLTLNEINSETNMFHIAFLIKISRLLGFAHSFATFEGQYYDYRTGHFDTTKPSHPYYFTEPTHNYMISFAQQPYYMLSQNVFSPETINTIFATILKIYDINIPGFRNIKSLEIIRELF